MNENSNDKKSLLIVDDNPLICDSVRAVAEGAGFNVVSTSDPAEFPNLYSRKIDVIVLDLNMPKIDGIELIRFLGENRSQAAIILISGYDAHVLRAAGEIATGRGLRVVASLRKPFSAEKLGGLLEDFSAPLPQYSPEGTDELPSVDELRQAITTEELVVFYQPKLDISSGLVAGFEALIRWPHKTKGMIPPEMFVSYAEKNLLIEDLTNLVIGQVIKDHEKWAKAGTDIKISINISAQSLENLEFPEQLSRRLKNHGLDPEMFTLEVTEGVLVEKPLTALDTLTRFRLKGFNLSIDDFGTGHSSLHRLQMVPFSELKIDKSFVIDADSQSGNAIIVENTINLAHELGLTAVAEGIENRDSWDLLVGLGCSEGQGWFMGKPMPCADIEDWLEDWQLKRKIA